MTAYFQLAAALFLYMVFWFIVSVVKQRNDVADVAWGLAFLLLAWLSFYVSERQNIALLANALVTVWGLRLSWHIWNRNRGKPEDFRYRQWRMEWKNFYIRSFLQVFMLQGLFLYIVALPVVIINLERTEGFHLLDVAGILAWLTGFSLESVADYQLKKFKSDTANKGRIITSGLWRYSRHPNYFGEAMQWWGIFLMALAAPGGWMTIVGPATITFLLRYVSGVPMLERKYKGNPEFESYKKKTSAFFPLPLRA